MITEFKKTLFTTILYFNIDIFGVGQCSYVQLIM